MDSDLEKIMAYIHEAETVLNQKLGFLQQKAARMGILFNEAWMSKFEDALPWASKGLSRTELSAKLLELCFESNPERSAANLIGFAKLLNGFVENNCDNHMQYLEINVAGFRKLLKRHDKQLPKQYHAVPTPWLNFHALVSRKSRKLLASTQAMCMIARDAQQRLATIAESKGMSDCDEIKAAIGMTIVEPKALGAECQMVLEVQKQLRAIDHGALEDGDEALTEDLIYMKPGEQMHNQQSNTMNIAGAHGDSNGGYNMALQGNGSGVHASNDMRQNLHQLMGGPQQQQQMQPWCAMGFPPSLLMYNPQNAQMMSAMATLGSMPYQILCDNHYNNIDQNGSHVRT
eukprot:gnl/MRDRNA2_/MRDRNA2_189966_c0_seq1.p1 gnl/MRDRNA2_/MRDRNA2_189966_c0~~gnl/MRDRNA2_/MRDRNA2_189966_c0_seq1.p1  ORF type:complete len:372 (-),score=78.70 gnl/MRDRNA2_/MRDRNA2_189966_c0_seq1:95-1129(-)